MSYLKPSKRSLYWPARGLASLVGRDRSHFSPSALVLALSTVLAMPGSALASDWAGTSSDWFTDANWNPNGVPGAADDVLINIAMNPTVVSGSAAVAKDVSVGQIGTGILQIVNNGNLTNAMGMVGAAVGSTGTVLVAGPGSSWTNTGILVVGEFGTGTLNIINGGTVSSNGGAIGDTPNSTGTVTINNASWKNHVNLFIGGAGSGTLAIAGGSSASNVDGYIGITPSSTGKVTVDGPSSTWTNGGVLVVGYNGIATLTIANGGAVTVGSAQGVTLASQAGSTGTLNIGDATGAPTADPGTLNAATVQFGAGTGTINFNHIGASYVFAPVISGLGTINHNAGNTNLTGDSSGFTGLTNVNGGRLSVNGSLTNSFVNVNSGGTLGGNGTVGNTFANAGGVVAPGNSIGTLNVNGNITFAANSTYQVEANAAGQSDKILVSGTATLDGGTVQVLAGAGNYAPTTSYSILSAVGGITGSFAGVTSNLAFLTPALSYDPTNVYLLLTRNSNSFGNVGLTANQIAAGAATETLGTGNAVYDAVLGLSAPQARNAYDQLSGEVHASARSVLLEDSRFVREAALDRLRAFDTGMAAGAETPGKAADWLSIRDTTFWGRVTGSWGTLDGDDNAAGVKRETAGLLIGADRMMGDTGRFGVVGGYSRSSFDINARNSSGTADNYHVGVYGGNRWGDLALRTGLGYTRHDISTGRTVNFPGFSDSLRADYKAATTQVFGELGYQIKAEQAELEPFVNLAHVNVSTKGLNEQGGAAALSSAGGSSGVIFSTLGLRASTNVGLAGGTDVTARGMLGWRHAFGDMTPTSSLAFAGSSPFAVAGVPIAKSAAVLEAGLDFRLSSNATLGLSYGGQFGSGLKDQTGRVNLNVKF